MKDRLYTWWKKTHGSFRKPIVFVTGIILICIAPIVGFVPGPGGILVFLLGIAILASEFDWALSLKSFFLKSVPKEVKKRWRPTPRWEYVFDITAFCLITYSAIFAHYSYWVPSAYAGLVGLALLIFNRSRLDRFKLWLKKHKH